MIFNKIISKAKKENKFGNIIIKRDEDGIKSISTATTFIPKIKIRENKNASRPNNNK